MGSFASSTTAASNSTPTSWKEVSVRLCSIGKMRCSLATIKGRRTGQPSPHLSRPANCMVSIRSLLCRRAHKARQSLASIAPRRAHALGLGRTAFRRSPRGVPRVRLGFALNPPKIQAIGTVGSENCLPPIFACTTSRRRRVAPPRYRRRAENIGSPTLERCFPRRDLVRGDVELLRQLSQCSRALDGGERHLRLTWGG